MAVARNRWILLAVSLAAFMTYLDNNVVNVAIPVIQRDLALSSSGLEWVVSAYILVFAGLLLAGGRLADVFGQRRLFLLGLGVFTIASLIAGLSDSAALLIGSRALQGLGAAMVTPTTLAILAATFPEPRERAQAVGIWGAAGAVALALGPLIGGALSQHASWGWIFFLNVPVGLVTMALSSRVLPADAPGQSRPLDLPGIVSSATALLALTYALIQGTEQGWTSAVILGCFAVTVAAGAAFVLIESRSQDPMVHLELFSDRAFTGGLVTLMMWGFGLFGIYFYTSLYLQNVLGFSPTKAGAAFIPMAVMMAAGAAFSEQVSHRVGAYRSIAFAMLLMAVGIASVSLLGQHASVWDLVPSFVIVGIGGGLTTSLTVSVLQAMPAEQSGVASALFNATRELSGLLGITVIGVVLRSRQSALARVGNDATTSFLGGYRLGLLIAAALVAAGGITAFLTLRGPASPVSDASNASTLSAELTAAV